MQPRDRAREVRREGTLVVREARKQEELQDQSPQQCHDALIAGTGMHESRPPERVERVRSGMCETQFATVRAVPPLCRPRGWIAPGRFITGGQPRGSGEGRTTGSDNRITRSVDSREFYARTSTRSSLTTPSARERDGCASHG